MLEGFDLLLEFSHPDLAPSKEVDDSLEFSGAFADFGFQFGVEEPKVFLGLKAGDGRSGLVGQDLKEFGVCGAVFLGGVALNRKQPDAASVVEDRAKEERLGAAFGEAPRLAGRAA